MTISKKSVSGIIDRAPAFARWAQSRFAGYTETELKKGYVLAMATLEEYIASGRSINDDALTEILDMADVYGDVDEDNVTAIIDFTLRCCHARSKIQQEAT